MQKEIYFHAVKDRFTKGFRWSFLGSIIFESTHIIHNSLMFYILGSSYYGLLGSLFSIIYLIINIVDFGFEDSFSTFLHSITQNKQTFKKVFPLYVLPQIFFLGLGSIVAFYFYKTIFFHSYQQLAAPFFFFLIISEGIRIFFRRFLHNIFFNKATVIAEQVLAFVYYATVWTSYYFLSQPLTIKLIFIPYLINSLFAIIIFIGMIIRFYKTLSDTDLASPKNLWRRILKARYYNYLINIEKFLISGNFLVPFFATMFGLRQAGLFKIATIVAHSIKALVKSAIHFSGAALLASLKTKSVSVKKEAFYALSGKLNHIIIFVALFLTVNYNLFSLFHSISPYLQSAWQYAFIFIGITLIHQLFVVYEQFYIIEEFANKLFIIKSIEFILFYLLIISNKHITPLMALVNIGLIQILCFTILATHAYACWKIKPYFKVKLSFVSTTLALSLLFFFAAHFLIRS